MLSCKARGDWHSGNRFWLGPGLHSGPHGKPRRGLNPGYHNLACEWRGSCSWVYVSTGRHQPHREVSQEEAVALQMRSDGAWVRVGAAEVANRGSVSAGSGGSSTSR